MKVLKNLSFTALLAFFVLTFLLAGCGAKDGAKGGPSPSPGAVETPSVNGTSAPSPAPPASPSPVILPGKAVVEFTVRDSKTGKPLKGIRISALKKNASTDKNGSCRLELNPGTYDVTLNHSETGTIEQITGESFVNGPQARQYDFELP